MNQTIQVAIATPYLTQNMSQRYDEDYVREQQEKYGYDPNNFAGVSELDGSCLRVEIINTHDHGRDQLRAATVPLHIIGSTRDVEDIVREQRGSGKVIARFSIFYGKASGYSGEYPEETGYALDLPKSVDVVKQMLTHAPTMLAIRDRNLDDLLKGLEDLNKHLQQPVLTTPYLQEVFS